VRPHKKAFVTPFKLEATQIAKTAGCLYPKRLMVAIQNVMKPSRMKNVPQKMMTSVSKDVFVNHNTRLQRGKTYKKHFRKLG
jgi:hypothetical protein